MSPKWPIIKDGGQFSKTIIKDGVQMVERIEDGVQYRRTTYTKRKDNSGRPQLNMEDKFGES